MAETARLWFPGRVLTVEGPIVHIDKLFLYPRPLPALSLLSALLSAAWRPPYEFLKALCVRISKAPSRLLRAMHSGA